jgi:hypothetical protein
MKTRRILAVVAFAVMVSIMLGGAVSAHHSRAGYSEKQIPLKGTVTSVSWRNPHIWINFDVKDATGKVVKWAGELSSTTSMMAAGMGRDTLKPGDEIVVNIAPAENGSPQGLLSSVNRADGTVVVSPNYRRDTR